jgi:hypothetical protein
MPVAVHIPIRIRVDTKTICARCGCINDALTKAVSRALANSLDVVLAHRGGYAGLSLNPPRFSWTGSGAMHVPATHREELEQRWAAILMEVADRVGVTDFAYAGAEVETPIPPNPFELLDRRRLHGSQYQIPSYGDDDELDEPEGHGTYNPAEQTEQDAERFLGPLGFREYSEPMAVIRDFRERILQTLGKIPTSGYLGALYRWTKHFELLILKFPEVQKVVGTRLKSFEWNRKGEVKDARAGYLPGDSYEVDWHADASSQEDFERVIYSFAGDEIQKHLRDIKRPHEDADVKAVIQKLIKAGGAPRGTVGFAVLRINGSDHSLIAAEADWPRVKVPIIPLVFPGEAATTGTAEEGGAGKSPGEGVEGGTEAGMRPCEAEPVKVRNVTIDNNEYEWGPFECEPPMYQLGINGDYMRELMRKVAGRLSIPECEYAGRFCIVATNVLGMRQYEAMYQAMNEQGELKAAADGKGNLGAVHFQPMATPSIQTLRDLASVIPDITHLESFTMTTYQVPEYSKLLGQWYTGNAASWELRFIHAMIDAMNEAIGRMFITACFSVLMQLMRASRKGIEDRIGNKPYATQFEHLIKNEILPLDYLKRLRDQLSPWVPKSVGQAFGESLLSSWEKASNRVLDMFEGRNPYGDILMGMPGYIVRDGGTFKIKDSKGTVWSMQDLDAEIALRTAIAEGIDPLVIQITADRHILDRFARNPNDIRGELAKLLGEMLDANKEKMKEAQDNPYFAFGASKIYEAENRFSGTGGSGYELTGLHKQAHELIIDSFKGDTHYRQAVKALFDTEEGKRAIMSFLEFAGVVLLCVVCAPLGVAAGIGTAVYHEHEAQEEKQLFRGLLDPEMVITRAELETDLFCAAFAVALSIVPEGGKIAEGVMAASRAALKKELKTAITAFGKEAAKGISKEVLKNLEKGILQRFAAEFVKAQVISQFIGRLVIGPVAEQISADFEKTLVAKAMASGGAR